MAVWLRDHLDHQPTVLLGRSGPFAQCSEDEHIDPRQAKASQGHPRAPPAGGTPAKLLLRPDEKRMHPRGTRSQTQPMTSAHQSCRTENHAVDSVISDSGDEYLYSSGELEFFEHEAVEAEKLRLAPFHDRSAAGRIGRPYVAT
jgi:hypothetical protein